MSTSKPTARFFPTLTEVVQPGTALPAVPVDVERLTQQVLERVKPRLEQQLRASLQAVLEEHLRTAMPDLQAELGAVVESVVGEALAKHTPGAVPKP